MFLALGMTQSAWAPLIPFAKARLGVDDGTLGLLLLCLGIGSLVAMPVTGVMTNHFGCRKVMVGASLVMMLTLPFLAIGDSLFAMALAVAIFGASIGTLDVAVNIQAVMVEKDSGRNMMSGFHGLFSLGGILGAGGVSLLLGFGLVPLVVLVPVLVMNLALLVFSTPGLLPYGRRDSGGPLFALPHGIVVLICLLCFIVFLSEGAVLDWGALFLIETQNVEPHSAGLGYTVFALAMTFGRFTGDRIVKALGPVRVMVLSGALAAVGFFLAVAAPALPLAYLGFLLVGLGAANIVPVLFTATGRQKVMAPSLAVAAVTTVGYAGHLIGPAGIGAIAHFHSLEAAFVLLGLGLVFVALVGPRALRGE
jgi:predicted MFS family arabinose efflux permease